jgi:hypothetical protein
MADDERRPHQWQMETEDAMDSDNNDVKFEKEIDIKIDFDFESDVDIKLEKDVNVDIKIEADADIKGNIATATFSVEAVGKDTLAEADVHVLAIEDELSSVDGVLIAAVN